MSSTRTILLILGFLSTLAVIALIAVAVTQNQPLPKNIKVLRAGPLREEGGWVSTVLTVMSLPLLALANLLFCLHAHRHLVLHLCGKTNHSFTGNHLLSNQPQLGVLCSRFLYGHFALRRAITPIPTAGRQMGCVCLVPQVWGQHTGVWFGASGGAWALFCPQYGIVLDAGSSHTNLYVYEWPAEKENDTGVVKQVEVCKVEGKRRKRSWGRSVG